MMSAMDRHPQSAEIEVTDGLTVAVARDSQRLEVRLSPDQACAVAGALIEYARRANAALCPDPSRNGSRP
jgi:hypothetical protein